MYMYLLFRSWQRARAYVQSVGARSTPPRPGLNIRIQGRRRPDYFIVAHESILPRPH